MAMPNENQIKYLDLQYEPGQSALKQHLITINHTNRSTPAVSRDEAICIYYEDGLGIRFYAEHLANGAAPSNADEFTIFTAKFGTTKNMSMLGWLEY